MAQWRPESHPRDWRGRFITTGARVRLQGGLMGRVTGIQPARRADLPASITVESDDGRVGTIPSDQLTIAEPPSGTVFIGDGALASVGDEVGRMDAPGFAVVKKINADGSVVIGSRLNDTRDEEVSPESLTRTTDMASDHDRNLHDAADANTPEPGAQAPAAEVTPEGVRSRYDLRAIRARATPQEQRDLARAERARDSAARAVESASYRRSSGGSRIQSRAEVRANQRVRDAEVEVQRVEDGIYNRLVQEETARRAAPAPAAPAAPTPDAPTNPDNPTPTGPTAADGLPLAAGDRITVNGRTGTIRSIRPGTGIAIYTDEDGRQRSSRIGNFTHLNDTPAETAPANAPEAPAAPEPSTPEPPTPAAPDVPAAPEAPAAPTGPVAADGRPLARNERITVNGRTGTVSSVRANAGIVVYRDDEGRQRSAQIARVNHVDEAPATTNEPTPAAPDTPTSTAGVGDPLPDGAEIDYGSLDFENMQAEATLPDGTRVRYQAGEPPRILAILDPNAPAPEQTPEPTPVAAGNTYPDLQGLGAQLATVVDSRALKTRLMREIEAVYNGDAGLGKNGARVQVTTISGTPSKMSYSMNVVDAEGRRIGNVTRSIKYSRTDYRVPIEVHNDLMMLDRNVQGQGIASDLYARQEEWFAAQGVPKVTIHANIDVGGFAWARKGYDYDGRAAALSHLGMLQYRAQHLAVSQRTPADQRPQFQAIAAQLTEWHRQTNDSPTGQRSWPTPYEVSQLGYTPGATTWPGKQLMLGTDWYAVKRLRRPTAA